MGLGISEHPESQILDPGSSDDLERSDILMALALAFARNIETDAGTVAEGDEAEQPDFEKVSARVLLAGVNSAEAGTIEQRLSKLENESTDNRMDWVAATLARAHASRSGECTRLDAHIHPSQIAETLRSEPARIQALVLRNLPAELAEPVSNVLGITAAETDEAAGQTEENIVAVVKRCFLSNFVSVDVLRNPTHLDLLSGVELARLVRLLGVRQMAIACRGIEEVETVASFLRRFSAEDSRAIAMHMLSMETIEPGFIEFAERLVQPEIDLGLDGAAMLDRIGLALLAAALRERDGQLRQYTRQKLPVEAARELENLLAGDGLWRDRHRVMRVVVDIETIAENLRCRPAASGARTASIESGAEQSLK